MVHYKDGEINKLIQFLEMYKTLLRNKTALNLTQ